MKTTTSKFYAGLHKLATQLALHMSDEGDEGSPQIEVVLKEIGSNYPWLYVDYVVKGPLSLFTLEYVRHTLCDFAVDHHGHLETVTLTGGPGFKEMSVRFKLVYTEKP